MKRYLIALGVVCAMLLSAAPAAAGEPVAPKDPVGPPDRHTEFIWWFHSTSKVEQSNDNESGDATAINKNNTDQSNDQKQFGVGGDAVSGPASSDGSTVWCDKGIWDPGKGEAYARQDYTKGKKVGHCADGASTGKAVGGDVDQSQTASNSNATWQEAAAESKAKQVAPINVNMPIQILSFGDDKVEQSNDNESGDASAINKNNTDQSNDQSHYGFGGNAESGEATAGDGSGECGCYSHGADASTGDAYGGDASQSQDASNSNSTSQSAYASSEAKQIVPINVNAPIRILSNGDDKVEQSNDNESGDASAGNFNNTDQSNDQKQLGVGGDATSGPATSDGGDASTGKAVGGDVDQSQSASNSNETQQQAAASSEATQILPMNVNAPIRILSDGDDKVEQSNDNESGDATAVNWNNTDQSNDQTQFGFGGNAESGAASSGDGSDECGCYSQAGDASTGDAYGGDVSQSQDASNSNSTSQSAEASSTASQIAPLNSNTGVDLLGHGLLGGPSIL
jgi:hypothetical protein